MMERREHTYEDYFLYGELVSLKDDCWIVRSYFHPVLFSVPVSRYWSLCQLVLEFILADTGVYVGWYWSLSLLLLAFMSTYFYRSVRSLFYKLAE